MGILVGQNDLESIAGRGHEDGLDHAREEVIRDKSPLPGRIRRGPEGVPRDTRDLIYHYIVRANDEICSFSQGGGWVRLHDP